MDKEFIYRYLIDYTVINKTRFIDLFEVVKDLTHYKPKTRTIVTELIWEIIKTDQRFTFERTSEIFITKGTKKGEKLLSFYPRVNNDSEYISHLILRK